MPRIYPQSSHPPRTLTLARIGAGMTMDQLAAMSGVNRKTISRLEAGKHAPRTSTAIVLAGALGYTDLSLLFPADFPSSTPTAPLPAGLAGGEALAPAAESSVAAAGGPGAADGERLHNVHTEKDQAA